MKHSAIKHKVAGQSHHSAHKPQKHDVNLQKNSTLYFQIGLIVCLLATYGLFEMRFETKPIPIAGLPPLDINDEIEIKNFREFKEEVKPVEPMKDVQILGAKDLIIREDDFEGKVTDEIIISEPVTNNSPVDPGIIDVYKPEENIELTIWDVDKVPIYPGCEGEASNKERLKCMSEKISQLIQRKFDPNLAPELGLQGVQRINVEFKIDKSGNIIDIKSRAPHKALENEALRVAEKIPNMKPGLQGGNPVVVRYNLPIVFRVQE